MHTNYTISYSYLLNIIDHVHTILCDYIYVLCNSYIGDRYYTANVHKLLHFADTVFNVGPLYVHSAFPFEGINGWPRGFISWEKDLQNQV